MLFTVRPEFWALFPEARIGVVVVQGLDNGPPAPMPEAAIEQALDAARAAALAAVGDADLATHPAVAPWRAAYQAFGAKPPSRYRSSIENLLRQARQGPLRRINPLVDLYNAVSLAHLLPCGGEDLAAVVGDIALARARGDELFVPLGSDEVQPPAPGEVIYRDGAGVLCRCWNWREAERTKLTPATRAAFLCIETPTAAGEAAVQAACTALLTGIRTHLGGTGHSAILSRNQSQLAVAL